MFEILKDRIRDNKDKYRNLRKAINQLLKEGAPIIVRTDKNKVQWFSLDPSKKDSFMMAEFDYWFDRLKSEAKRISKVNTRLGISSAVDELDPEYRRKVRERWDFVRKYIEHLRQGPQE